jgi:hypothetical protein
MKNYEKRIKSKLNDFDLLWSSEFFVPDHFDKIECKIGIYSWHLIPTTYVNETSIFKYMDLCELNSQ